MLFCKLLPSSNNDLAKHCLKESVPFVPFYTFTEVRLTRVVRFLRKLCTKALLATSDMWFHAR